MRSLTRQNVGGANATSFSGRSVATVKRPVFTTVRAPSRGLGVQVEAKKGKGSSRTMMNPATAGMPREPPTPDVDPENAEFVVFVRAINYMEGKIPVKEGRWLPVTIVKGSQAANFLVKALENEWGRKLYSKTLIRQIAASMYKDRAQIEKSIKGSYPPFADVPSKNFRYGFKVRDKTEPKAWLKPDGLTELPSQAEATSTALDSLKDFFKPDNLASLFKTA